MLKRGARRLKNGRCILDRVISESGRSQRALHSDFWSHGAADIDLPPWWIFSLQVPPKQNTPQYPMTMRHDDARRVSRPSSGPFLEFLHPPKTINYMQNLLPHQSSLSCTSSTRGPKSKTVRTFTSKPRDEQELDVTSHETPHAAEENCFNLETGDIPNASNNRIKPFSQKFDILRVIDEVTPYDAEDSTSAENPLNSLLSAEAKYEDAWTRFENVDRDLQIGLRAYTSVTEAVKTAAHILQEEYNLRTRELFDQVPFDLRLAQHYHQAIYCALREADYDRLLALHEEALFRFPASELYQERGSIRTPKILSNLISRFKFGDASKLWGDIRNRFGVELPLDIWTKIDKIPYSALCGKLCKMELFCTKLREEQGHNASLHAQELLHYLIIGALSRCPRNAEPKSTQGLIDILGRLVDLSILQAWENAIEQLLSAEIGRLDKMVMWLYAKMRRKIRGVPSKPLLKSLIIRLRDDPSRFNYAMRVYDDYKRWYGDDREGSATMMLNTLAYQGDLTAVSKLIAHEVQHSSGKMSSRHAEALLRVYMRRADIRKVETLFNLLEQNFQFKPTLPCWHLLIMAHSRVNDIKGAIRSYNRLCESGIKTNPNTYEIMLSVHAKRGDLEPIQKLLSHIRTKDIQVTMPMLDFVVLAYVKRNEIEAAEKLCRQFLTSKVEGSRLRMWNFVLLEAALKWRFQRVNRVFLEMQLQKVGYDDRTVAALMHSLCNENRPEQAHMIINKVMPRLNIQPTTLHWSILMKGYLRVRQVRPAFLIYRNYLKRRGRPDYSMKMLLLKAASMSDIKNLRRQLAASNANPDDPLVLPTADAMLQTMERELSPADAALTDHPMGVGPSQRIDEAAVSGAYQFLTYLYGVKGSSHKVDELYERYEATLKRFYPDAELTPSLRMLASLMVDYRKTRYAQGMEQSWALARKKAAVLSRRWLPAPPPPMRRGPADWVLPPYRAILDLCLGQYLLFLRDARREGEIYPILRQLRADGYWISSLNYNLYVQALAASAQRPLQVHAFRECEKRLMPGWQGWFGTTSVAPPAPALVRFRVKMQQPRLGAVNLHRAAPAYRTLVVLARLWMDLRARDQFERAMGGTFMRQLGQMAPRTVEAVQAMPKMGDRLQGRFLADEA